ncbi:hypothetical protein [Streptomyces sp. NPDC001292]|uniref:hypothetical protein n=1 Tax=Streptomyces sp. NPDC001292 TaxID=3364558 RepID=UPI00368E1356
MAVCLVCGADLPAQRGPRARRYCSRACQAKAYRARQRQRDAHLLAIGDAPGLLTRYDGVPASELADQLALAARRLAAALTAGQPVDDFDLGVLARLPAVLTARAHQAAPTATAGETAVRRDQTAAPTAPADAAAVTGPGASRDDSGRSARPATRAARASRDDSAATATPRGIEPRPQRLAKKKARAVVDAAELVRHPEHRDNHGWILRSGDTVIGHVEPTYGGASRSGRNGWTGRLGGHVGPRRRTRDEAAVDLALRWVQLVTAAPKRTITGDR